MRFPTFHFAYVHNLHQVYNVPEFINAPRGSVSRERLGLHFELINPRERVPHLASRKIDLIYNFAKTLWYLSNRNDLEFIGYYAPSLHGQSQDGKTLAGTAYGTKIFQYGERNIDQWQQVLRVLQQDPDSKRAVVQIFDPTELSIADNIDVACTLALQFFIRCGKLYTAGFMRANDAFGEIVSDVFSFTLLQEFMATQLGLELGSYYHNVGSYHVYAPDFNVIEQVLAEANNELLVSPPFPAMPKEDNWDYVRELLRYEQELRTNCYRLSAAKMQRLALPSYWSQVAALFEIYREIRYEKCINRDMYEVLLPLYQRLITQRWSKYMTWADAPITA